MKSINLITNKARKLFSQNKEIENNLLLNSKVLNYINLQNIENILKDIKLSEYKVFSQWGDDGIIQFLINYLDISEKKFIEFGVGDYRESNTRLLLINNNWKGLIMDCYPNFESDIKSDEIYWKYNLTAKNAFITKENINSLINESNFKGNIGLLHIDIDGNEYWVWESIEIEADLVIIEYNSSFGYENPWTVLYDQNFERYKHHYSGLYFGVSVLSLCDLAEKKGYSFIGCNSAGNNAYFVKNSKLKNLKTKTAKEGYVEAQFRESKDKNGNFNYLSGNDKLKEIIGMKVYNTRTNQIETIK
ncbi:MAG: hypothetical protein IAE65_05010 [Ignavibacteria bacterium]|nr:hypothetical protein [Ignavibacteria bacterium]